MPLQKKDFIEIEFTGKTKDDVIFDSNIKEELQKINSKVDPEQEKPFVFALGENMFLQGIDDFLIGKNVGKYEIELSPEKAFGFRNAKLIQVMPMKIFVEHKLNPFPGAVFNFDGRVAKVLSVSGGRVRVDFNHPLAGKNLIYNINVLRKIEKLEDKTRAVINFFLRQEIPFEIQESKLIIKTENQIGKFLELFHDKFKELLDLDLEIKEEKKTK